VGAWHTGSAAEVLDGFAVLGASKQEGVGASGCAEHELIQSEALASSLENPGPSSFGEPESGHLQLGHLQKSDVISHCANNHSDSVSAAVSHAGKWSYVFAPRCLMRRDREIGGRFTREAISLLTTV
jgi:hypothetical protein